MDSQDLMIVVTANQGQLAKIHDAITRGARAVVLQPDLVFGSAQAPTGEGANFAEGLWPLDEGWRPELRQISWWGSPGAWGYGRTALALQSPFLEGLPQAVALEAQPEYQMVAPHFTWTMQGRPQDLDMRHAVMEDNLAVDTPYTSDLFSLPLGAGKLVLTSLRIVPGLNTDPAADRILENIVNELLSTSPKTTERPTQNASGK